MKKIIILIFIIFSFFKINYIFAQDITIENNIISKAFQERKQRVLNLINGGELEVKINNLKKELEKLQINKKLNNEIIKKINKQLDELEKEEKKLKENLKKTILDSDEFEKFFNKYEKEIKLKKDLVKELNKTIEENKIKEEKINVLLEKYINEKNIKDENKRKEKLKKYYIFFGITLLVILIYSIIFLLTKKQKIDSKKTIYINFFILFSYISFLIWFLFYLYPQLSIFLIFISGYLLVINAHLVASFVGSIAVIQRYKIGDIIYFGDIRGQIIKITPLYTVILPLTFEESIFKNKPIYIPNINLLKENITKDESPNIKIHKFKLTIRIDSGVDVMQFVETIENNILVKFLHNKLHSLDSSEETFRISFDHTNFGHITVIFIWKGDDLTTKKVERKIIGHFQRLLNEIKEKEKIKQTENKI